MPGIFVSGGIYGDLKKHLNIDINDDDDLLLEYEAAAVELAEHFMNREIIQRDDAQALSTTAAGVPAAVKQYIRCQVGDFYKQREITATGQFATFYKGELNMLNAGILSEKIQFYYFSSTQNAAGESIENYTAGPVVRANVRQVSIRKLLESGRDIAAQAMTVKIRLNSDICVGDRILWREQFYNVLNITTDREERSEILAVELVQD